MSVTLYCNDPMKKGCHWSGDPSELHSATDALDDRDFTHCPQCGGTDFYEEEEEDEEEN
jgi:hypothetical protein